MTNTNINMILELLKIHTNKDIAIKLNVAPGTITRWIELNNISSIFRSKVDIKFSKPSLSETLKNESFISTTY